MGLFSRYKDLHDYKILEVINVKKTPIGINGASGAKCRVLYEDENVQVLSCEKERFQNKSHYLLTEHLSRIKIYNLLPNQQRRFTTRLHPSVPHSPLPML